MFIRKVDDTLVGVSSSITLSPDHHVNKLLESLVVLVGFKQIAVAAVNLPAIGTRALLALLLKVGGSFRENSLMFGFGMGVEGGIRQVTLSAATDIISLISVLFQSSFPFLPQILSILAIQSFLILIPVFIVLIVRLNNNLIIIIILPQSSINPLLFFHLIINYNVSIL